MSDLNINPTKIWKERVSKIKDLLPKNYMQIVMFYYPEYDSSKGYNLMSSVKSLRTADIRLTEIYERIVRGDLKLPETQTHL